MRVHRLIAIILLIESRGRMKASELAAALETSVRSIYRDIDVLGEAGIPIVTSTGPNGGVSLMEGYTANLRQLNGDEVIHLYLTGMGFHSGRQSESRLQLNNALLKLEKTLPAPYQADIRKAKNVFYFDDAPWWSEPTSLPGLETLRTALWKGYKVRVEYRKVSGELSTRILQPYGLVVKQGEWYLVAFCERAEALRTFKCERISAVHLLEEDYELPAGFSLEMYWRSGEEAFKQSRRAAEYYPVTVRVHKGKQIPGAKFDVIQTVEEGNSQIVTVNMYSFEQACEKVFTLPADAEVLEPQAVRVYMKERIGELQRIYL
ncbi:helix-turn-helix transcriptional regulator [Paenibacillus ihuae]|uniref:helix-turn-helix transcriptional regulator n=1 Tax=Paenibacillus ihuae TaxID=1232431 RepID=UPI0009E6E72B|nr:YafY family protein [Paenibacillus ihuae]